jgi:hypothetical protein
LVAAEVRETCIGTLSTDRTAVPKPRRACLWCASSFEPRRGGSPQRFCLSPRRIGRGRPAVDDVGAPVWLSPRPEPMMGPGLTPGGAAGEGEPAACF